MSTELTTHPGLSKATALALKEKSSEIAERIGAPAAGLRVKGNVMSGTIQVGELEGEEIQAVIVDFITKRQYYDTPWREGDPYRPPVCYGFAQNPDLMVPHPNVKEIGGEVQSKDCRSCPLNEWGTDGSGKACKERRVMLLLPPGDEHVDDEFWELDIPVKSLKSFDAFVRQVDEMWSIPPVGAICTISLDPTAKFVQYQFSDPQPNLNVEAHFARMEEAAGILAAKKFEAAEEDTQRKVVRKKAARKAPARAKR